MREIIFLTSNRLKFLHAKYIAKQYDVEIIQYQEKFYGIGYEEPRISDRDELLKKSMEDAIRRWQKNISNPEKTFFFIEDTSVIIDSLSEKKEFPGVDIKFWMKKNSFSSVDKKLKQKGNNRKVTVRSDILLYIPKYYRTKNDKEYKKFTSSINGKVTDREYNLKTNPIYPWLDNKTFNKWFVPEGCDKPISSLSINIADRYDFRKNAIKEMLEFLESRNIPHKKIKGYKQENLYLTNNCIFLICGLPCAGKTTLGIFLSDKFGYYHIEASDFMYLSYYNHHGVNSKIKIGDFAEKALKENPNVVVDQIIDNIKNVKNIPTIITGFRSPKELERFLYLYDGPYKTKSVLIEADFDLRWERNINRNKLKQSPTKEEFLAINTQQLNMGLRKIIEQLHLDNIVNNKSIDFYLNEFISKYKVTPLKRNKCKLEDLKKIPEKLEVAILLTLINSQDKVDNYLTTTQITYLVNNFFNCDKSKNNISRYFNQRFHPYYEIQKNNGKLKYRLSNTGRGRAKILLFSNPIIY